MSDIDTLLQRNAPTGMAGPRTRTGTAAPTAASPAAMPSAIDSVLVRNAPGGLSSQVAQGLAEGVSLIAGIPADFLNAAARPFTGGRNVFGGEEGGSAAIESGLRQLFDISDADPDTTFERFTRNLARETGAALPFTVGLARTAARMGQAAMRAPQNVAQRMAQPFATAPAQTGAMEAAAITGTAGGLTAAQELAPGSPVAEAIGGVAGAFTGAGAIGRVLARNAPRAAQGVATAPAEATPPPTPQQPQAPASTAPTAPQGALPQGPAPGPQDPTLSGSPRFDPSQPEWAGNINLNRIQGENDIRNVLQETARDFEGFVDARRGVISNVQTQELADDLGMTVEQLTRRRRGQAFNAEEALAARALLAQSADNVVDLAKVARGGSDQQLVDFTEALTRHRAIQEQVAGLTAEAGRLLQSFRITAQSQAARERQLRDLLEGHDGLGRADTERLARIVSEVDDPAALSKAVRLSWAAKTKNQLFEIWYNNMLSGPQTQSVNILSNFATQVSTIPEHMIAAGLGVLRRSPDKVFAREVPARIVGFLQGTKDGLRLATKAFITEEPSDVATKFAELRQQRAIPGTAGRIIRIPSRLLMASDEFFKETARRMELQTLATRQAAQEKAPDLSRRVSEIVSNPSEDMAEAAREMGRVLTFTNRLGPVGQAVSRVRDVLPFGIGRLNFPFLRTPTNIMTYSAKRTPFAPVFKEVREELSGKKGKAARDLAWARMLFGSGIMALIANYAAQGRITGSPPNDPALRGLWRASGRQPYSIKIGDTWYSYQRFDPLAILMGMGADFATIANAATDEELEEIAVQLGFAAHQNLLNRTYMSGLQDTIKAIDDPQRYGGMWAQRLVGSVVPTWMAQITRIQDPYLRDVQNSIDRIKSRVPGWSETLPVRRDVFGEPIMLEGSAGPDWLSPIWISRDRADPVAEEMLRIRYAPSRIQRKVGGVELTPQQHSELSETAGKMAKRTLDQIVPSPGFQRLPEEGRRQLFKRTFDQARNAARAQLLARYPEIMQQKARDVRALWQGTTP